MDLGSGAERKVADRVPVALAWSPDGRLLASAVPEGAMTLLELRGPDGAVASQHRLDGVVMTLHWRSPAQLLALAGQLKSYSFGGNLRQLLHSVRLPEGQITSTLLHDTTIKRTTKQSTILQTFRSTLAPLGDELAYTRFHEPPNAAPHLNLILRHLATGTEKVVARVDHLNVTALFSADGERLLVGDGTKETRWINAHKDGSTAVIDSPGRSLARSARGTFLIVDGRLLRGGKQIGVIPKIDAALFIRGGDLLLRRTDGGLMLLAGLREQPTQAPSGDVQTKLRQLKRWRAEGLISTEEYNEARKGLDRK